MTIYYGAGSERELMSNIRRACEIVSPRTVPVAMALLAETCAAETAMCSFMDGYAPEGKGAFQFDSVGFEDVKDRFNVRNPQIVNELYHKLGINWANLSFDMLEYAPLLGAVLCRAKYYLVPESIPETREGRAKYWKKYYNSSAGAGTVEHYLEMSRRYIDGE